MVLHEKNSIRHLLDDDVYASVDLAGENLPPGELGEIVIRGPNVMKGYFNRPEETEEAMLPGHWLRSGDIGRMDEEGYFYIVDRVKDMIIVSGYKVRDVYHGAALVEYDGGMIGVEPGEVVPGVGRVTAIRERGGRWVVVTEKGEILGDAHERSYAEPPPRRRFGRELFGFIPRPFAPPFFAPY